MRIGLDVHVLSGPSQGTVAVWTQLLGQFPPDHTYVLYSFDPEATRRLYPAPWFEHRRIPIRQPHARIQLVLPWMARRDACDVFHVNYFGPLVGAPGLVVTMHDVLYLDFPDFAPLIRQLQLRWLGGLTAHAARRVITVSQYAKQRILHHFGLADDRVTVIYPGLSDEWLATASGSQEHDDRIRRELRLPARYLFTVGRWDPRKNFATAARVTSQLRAEGLVDGLVIAGPDDFGTAAIAAQLKRDGTDSVITRLPRISDEQLRAVYRGAAAVLYLSLAEGFGYPALEAMATGAPCIASNRTSIPEICGDGALVVDPDNTADVIAATRRVLTDPAARETIVHRGRARASQFTARRMADETLEVYRSASESPTTRTKTRPGARHVG